MHRLPNILMLSRSMFKAWPCSMSTTIDRASLLEVVLLAVKVTVWVLLLNCFVDCKVMAVMSKVAVRTGSLNTRVRVPVFISKS